VQTQEFEAAAAFSPVCHITSGGGRPREVPRLPHLLLFQINSPHSSQIPPRPSVFRSEATSVSDKSTARPRYPLGLCIVEPYPERDPYEKEKQSRPEWIYVCKGVWSCCCQSCDLSGASGCMRFDSLLERPFDSFSSLSKSHPQKEPPSGTKLLHLRS
jgi:hypothetical protein